jgi:CRISPR locus-related DNA-binding protein
MEIFGTLGFTPAKFLPTLRERDDVERAVVFHNNNTKSKQAAREIDKYCRSIGLEYLQRPVDAFDLVECAAAMQQEIRTTGKENVLFNITGGTKVLTAAAILTCILEGVRAIYIHEETGEEVRLPLLTAPYDDLLSNPQRQVLQHVWRHPGCSQQDICNALELTKPTVSHHIRQLVEHGLLLQVADPTDARRKALHVIPSARLLLHNP